MYLEKLEIQGFKSFANKNSLVFPGMIDAEKRGITAIVGPNGSGKSNISDAVRWVLGEQSLKTLRGKKSEDVIFSGSDQKSRLGMAEVSLHLNNEDKKDLKKIEGEDDVQDENGKSFLEYSKIVITRRLYRSGESEYLINDRRVRLADVQMLLAKANFGQRTYSVIGQGMVEGFLSGNAADKKDFFDEATGVKQFQIKRDSALNKLQASYENLQQVEMLLVEIKPRLKTLTRQVEKLKKRDQLEKELKNTQINYYAYLWKEIDLKLTDYNNRFLELEKVKIEKEQKLEKLNEELNKIKTKDHSEKFRALEMELERLRNNRSDLLGSLARLQAELEINLEASGQFDVSWLERKGEELKTQKNRIIEEIENLSLSSYQEKEAGLREELSIIEKDLVKFWDIRRSKQAIQEKKDFLSRQLSKLDASLEARLEAARQTDSGWLTTRISDYQKQLEEVSLEASSLKKDLPTTQEKENKLQLELSSIEQKISEFNGKIKAINRWLEENKRQDHKEEISRLVADFLKELEKLEKENNLEFVKRELKKLKENFEQAITELISGENAEKLSEIKIYQSEVITLAIRKQELSDESNKCRLAIYDAKEKIRLLEERNKGISKEISSLTEQLAKSETKFDAEKISQEKKEVTRQINELEEKLIIVEEEEKSLDRSKEKQQLIDQINECRLEISANQEKKRLLNEQKTGIEKEIVDIETKLQKSQVKFDAEKINQEKTEINQKILNIEERIQQTKQQVEILDRERREEKEKLFSTQRINQSLQAELNTINVELNNLKINSARQETRLEDLENNIRADELELNTIKSTPIDQTIDQEKSGRKINELKSQLEQIGGIDPETEKEYEETKSRYDFLDKQTTDLNETIRSLEKIIFELDTRIKSRFDEEFKLISEKFNEYFKILFNGGLAKILKINLESDKEENASLETASDAEITADKLKKLKSLRKQNSLDSSGIEVQATPPGKKIQNISMLSGGERALTAIALICAIISANPSPFVFLDEVDAALDEANSERLAQILDDLSHKTQFIAITHNRASMRKANVLYGVTMQSDGVSKLLSVKLEEASAQT